MTQTPAQRELFSIRPATADDLPQMFEIEKAVHQPGLDKQSGPLETSWSLAAFEGELQKSYSHSWVVTDDETDSKVMAFVIFWIQEEPVGGDAEILNLAVDLPYRGMGLARKLLQAAVKEAMRKGKTRMRLEVRKSNTPAIELYQKNLFTINHLRKAFYSDGQDAWVMTLELDEGKVSF